MLKRKIYNELLKWKLESKGKTALLIEGARRIGKSTIVEEFAKNEYETYIYIDLAFANDNIHSLFQDMNDLNYFFMQLQLIYGVNLKERESLIIFDEVQFSPKARQAIKKLVADGRYDYIETGSLISINKNVKDILIPSEERRLQMYPLDFEEFLWALGDESTMPLLDTVLKTKKPLGQAVNRELLRKFRLYMMVGGMPQAVLEYMESNNLELVDKIKRDIIDLYEQDFYKIDANGKISGLYEKMPSELNRHTKNYQISSVFPNERKSTLINELSELIASKTVLPSYNLNDPNVGLSSLYDTNKFRLYSADTGLLVTLMFRDKKFTENEIYKKMLSDKLPTNLGIIFENIVAQILVSRGYKLYYHTYYDSEQKRSFEVDFIISKGSKIIPIEVKSSTYRSHTSLDKFTEKYSSRISDKIVIHTKDLSRKNGTLYLPIYMAQLI